MPRLLLTATVLSTLVLSVAEPSACGAAQDRSPGAGPVRSSTPAKVADGQDAPRVARGEFVSGMSNNLCLVFQDRKHNYWFGSDGHGVYRYDGKTLIHFTAMDGLCNNQIREIQEDKSGNMFFTTLEGISKFDGQVFTTLIAEESNAPDKGWRLAPDDLWFRSLYGQPGHNGPFRYDGKSLFRLKLPRHQLEDIFHARFPNSALSPYEVYNIYKDSRGHVWIGTFYLGACRYDGQSWGWLHERHLTETANGGAFGIRSMIEDKNGAFWLCNTRYRFHVRPKGMEDHGAGFVDYKRVKGISRFRTPGGDDLIYYISIIEDDRRNLWMATYDMGVWRYDGENMTQYPVQDGARDIRLYSMYKDNHGGLWLGAHEAGAYKFNGKTFVRFRP